MQELYAKTPDDLKAVAAILAQEVFGRVAPKEASVIGLYGDLGSGKTTFVKSIAESLGVVEPVVSPTFIIERVYAMDHPRFARFIHIDAYRLRDSDELLSLGWEEISKDPKNLIFIEWADRIEAALPYDAIKMYFEGVDERTRKIRIVNP
ncbi:MAG: tRNA (adenosine(37)-N6)-threonylcarbamoyltransferase complex ATPase subunit type 1 TsaE [Parcubacteria group bacterium]|nr:tRNA (adenosine(37)-N6)-threonylcarbamoyltransferase complex ATPase subunit type 1 TsaE [Parcubacteria group bacterium]